MGRRRLGRHHSVAHLSALQPPITSRHHCRPSPCDRLSRPRTTTAAPPHPEPISRRCAQPEARRWLRRPGQTRGGSRVHLSIARRRRHPTRPLRHRRGYPAARHHGLPLVAPTCRGVPRLRDEGDGCASLPAQIRQVRAGATLRGVERRFLAYAFPPRSPHPRRLAVPTRHGFVRAAPTRPGTSRDRLPSASPPRCDGTEAKVSHLHSINKRLTAHRRSDASGAATPGRYAAKWGTIPRGRLGDGAACRRTGCRSSPAMRIAGCAFWDSLLA